MSLIFLFLSMIFCHIVDDYYLQRILASMKQKSWWESQSKNDLYKYDYIAALVMHSLSWSFMIMLPLAIFNKFNVGAIFLLLYIINTIIHAIVDDLKANKKVINLIIDQTIHIIQIIITFIIFINVI